MKTDEKSGLAPRLRESFEHVWLAGLGALSLAESEGANYFETLVKRGEKLEKRAMTALEERMSDATSTLREIPTEAIGRIETTVEGVSTNVLHRLNVPTRTEIKNLTKRVETLADKLEKESTPAKRTARPKTTSASPRARA